MFMRLSICNGSRSNKKTLNGKKHKEMAAGASASHFFFYLGQLKVSLRQKPDGQCLWQNITSFPDSGHAMKLFIQMFPDSNKARKFACGRTKYTAKGKEAFTPHYHPKFLCGISNQFSILQDESNDNVDKSCIILIRVLDEELGNVKTRFLDIPLVNIDTAANIFGALRESLQKFTWTSV